MSEVEADELAARYLGTGAANQLTLLAFIGPSRLAHALRTASPAARAAVAKTLKPWEEEVFTEPLVSTPRPVEEESCYRSLLLALINALDTGTCAPLPSTVNSRG